MRLLFLASFFPYKINGGPFFFTPDDIEDSARILGHSTQDPIRKRGGKGREEFNKNCVQYQHRISHLAPITRFLMNNQIKQPPAVALHYRHIKNEVTATGHVRFSLDSALYRPCCLSIFAYPFPLYLPAVIF